MPVALVLIGVWVAPARWTHSLPEGWQLTLVLAGVALSLSFIVSIPLGLLKGRGQWRVFSLVVASGQIIQSVTVVLLLSFGAGLPALSASLIAASLGNLFLATLVAIATDRRAVRALSVDRHSAKALLQYGGNIQTSNLVQVVNTQTDKLILVAFVPLSWIGLFELGLRLALTIRNLALSAFPPIVSRAANEGSGAATDDVARFYRRQLHQTYRFIVCPLVAGLPMVFAFAFLWLGRGFGVSAGVAVLLTLGYSLNLFTGPGTSVARGAGRPSLDRNYSLVGFAVNVLFTLALGFLWGGWGVVAATVLGLVSSSVLLLHWVDRWLDVNEATLSWRGYVWTARVELPLLIAVSLLGLGLAYLLVDTRFSAAVFLAVGSALAVGSGATREVLRRRRAATRVTHSVAAK